MIGLSVRIAGVRPAGPGLPGDKEFEASREAAQIEHDALLKRLEDPAAVLAHADRAVEIATNKRVDLITIHDIKRLWDEAGPRDAGTSKNYETYIRHFIAWMRRAHPGVVDIRFIDTNIAQSWVEQLRRQGIINATLSKYISGVSACLKCGAAKANLKSNPFHLIKRGTPKNSVAHRKPFRVEEVSRILDACDSDPVVGPAIVTAICSGMRRRDCVLLERADVDLEAGFVRVRPHKTGGEKVQIPIFPRLRKILDACPTRGKYMFPEPAKIYLAEKDNKNFFTLRLKKILAQAGIDYDARNDFKSEHKRLRKASQSGWHAFKATFVTVARDAGVPHDLLQKVVGNDTLRLVIDTYYQPDADRITSAFAAAMPASITGLAPGATLSPRQLVEQMKQGNWRATRTELLRLLK